MAFCTRCGSKLNNGAAFCTQCGAKVGGSTTQPRSMYEVFTPALGLGKKFIITENSLIYGSEEYSYSKLTQINVVNPPMQFTNGVAQTMAEGKCLTLAFEYSQKDRFANALTYANKKIASAHGNVQNYKYILQSPNGSKLEIYDEYAILYYIKSGIQNIIGNSMRGGTSGTIIYLSDLSLQLTNSPAESAYILQIGITNNNNTSNVSMRLNAQDIDTAQAIILYIENEKTKNNEQNPTQEITSDTWGEIVGTARKFPLCDKELEVSENMDIFNSYRLKFRELASICADNARKEYDKKVQNLLTYLEFFPKIYNSHLGILIKKALDIFISEGIWTVTEDSFTQKHLADFHLAIDTFSVTLESIELTSQANRRRMANIMSFIPNLSGGGFGLKGAVKGIAAATAFNIVRDGAEAELINIASNINQAQQYELYCRIVPDNLFELVFTDYWRVFLSLVYLLNQNGKSIWWPTIEATQQANNIFQNMSNPKFPQNKLLDVFLDILKVNPYNAEYHKFMISQFGENEETSTIKNYFGYTDFSNPRIS